MYTRDQVEYLIYEAMDMQSNIITETIKTVLTEEYNRKTAKMIMDTLEKAKETPNE